MNDSRILSSLGQTSVNILGGSSSIVTDHVPSS